MAVNGLTNCRRTDSRSSPASLPKTNWQSCAAPAPLHFTCPAASDSVLVNGDGPPHGVRNLLRLWPDAAELARKQPLAEILMRVLGPSAGIVRGLYFDKPPGGSWGLPWRRDTTIAVKSHGPLGRFGKPTVKAGVPHVVALSKYWRQW